MSVSINLMNMMPITLENESLIAKISKDELKKGQATTRISESIGYENTDILRSEYDLIHEHDFVTEAIDAMNYLHCVTCNKYFCQSCGKSVTGNLDSKSENGN